MPGIDDAIAIWKAGVAAVDPRSLVVDVLRSLPGSDRELIRKAPHIHIVGAGKAGAAMAAGAEEALADVIEKIAGTVNIPDGVTESLQKIELHAARLAGSNHPTEAGVEGAEAILNQLNSAGKDDVAIVLISGGGSALLPAPVDSITLADKQLTTKLLHASGATINEMNCVRKHLSRVKGGCLVEMFPGRKLWGLIISDVIGDPLDVIASGPTVPDPTTYANALAVLDRYTLSELVPAAVVEHLQEGVGGYVAETPKSLPDSIVNLVIGSNRVAVNTAAVEAKLRNWPVIDLGSDIQGEARVAANRIAEAVRATARPSCFLFGGETTVTLGPNPGKGGRNQEFVLALLCELGEAAMQGVTILCGGTDGEDGPTDATGAIGTLETLQRAKSQGLNPRDYLDRHDAYHFFEATGGLFKTGLTGTNVMDLGVILLR